ncbi:MAG: hypothetical protein ABI614_08425 [Planctomycetota bacterium]
MKIIAIRTYIVGEVRNFFFVVVETDEGISNFAVQEVARLPRQVLNELFPRQVTFESGHLLPPTLPGLGVEMNEAAVAKYPEITPGDCPRLTRPDGSYTNW